MQILESGNHADGAMSCPAGKAVGVELTPGMLEAASLAPA